MPELAQPSELARETLKRLAAQRMQPTPENYRSLYHEIAGTPSAEAFPERELKSILAALPRGTPDQIRFARQVETAVGNRSWANIKTAMVEAVRERETGSRNWSDLIRGLLLESERRRSGLTAARKRESLEHVLTASAADPDQLHDRLQALIRSWEQASVVGIEPSAGSETDDAAPALSGGLRELLARIFAHGIASLLGEVPELRDEALAIAEQVRGASNDDAFEELATRIEKLAARVQWVAEDQAEIRNYLLQLLRLIVENIGELSSDNPWLCGQIAMLNDVLSGPLSIPRLEDIQNRLKDLIVQQGSLKKNLDDSRERLKSMLSGFVERLAAVTESTGDYQEKLSHCAARIGQAKDIAELSSVVEEVLRETQSIHASTTRVRDDLVEMRARAEEAEKEIGRLHSQLAMASELVRQDQLTGALNRKGLDEALDRELARARRRESPLCLALLDIDNFKRLNDTYGHQTGDNALVHLAKVIRETLRPQDTVARYGGEEFVILLSDTGIEDGLNVMKRLQRELTKRFFLHNNERVLITFSAGIAEFAASEERDAALARADAAMYRAKAEGRNRVLSAG
jgi:diguanylate cyclase